MDVEYDALPDFLRDMNAVLKDADAAWLGGQPPNYDKVNRLYFKERTKEPAKGSLEDLLTNLIKNWEKEFGHKTNPADWRTMDPATFRMGVNGRPWLSLAELARLGPYNAFIGESEYYAASRVPDPAQSQKVFRTALCEGFALEILEVYSPPPRLAFKWRHWGRMEGGLKCPMRGEDLLDVPPNGETVELTGVSVVRLNQKYQMTEIEHFLRAEQMFEQMLAEPALTD